MRKPVVHFDRQLFEEICDRHAAGETLSAICRSDHRFPDRRNFIRWSHTDPELAAMYADAGVSFEETLVDDCLDISNKTEEGVEVTESATGTQTRTSDMLGHRKLKIDTRLKLLAIKNPARWGAKVDLNHGGQANNPIRTLIAQINGTSIQPVPDEPDGE